MAIFQYSSFISALLPLLFILFFKVEKDKKLIRAAVFYTTISFIVDFIVLNRAAKNADSQEFLILYTFFEACFWAYFFYKVFANSISRRKITLIALVTFLAIFGFSLFSGSKKTIDLLQVAIESIFILFLCILYLHYEIVKPEIELLFNQPRFWAVWAIMLYMSGTFFLFAVSYVVDPKLYTQYWEIAAFFNILKNLLIAGAVLVAKSNSPITINTIIPSHLIDKE